MERGTPAECAIARRWRTAFVDPPIAMTIAIAFSNASRVRSWSGSIRRLIAPARTSAERAELSDFSASSAAIVDEYIRLSPIASIAEDIVLAVNMPPQEPAPGQQLRSTSWSSLSLIFLALYSPTASNALTTVRSLPRRCPGLLVPP